MEPIDTTIELTIPPDPRLLRMVRLVASGLATTAGFDVEELDDLRIAVDEAVTALLEGGDGARVPLRFDVEPGAVAMSGETAASGTDPLDPDRIELSSQILAAVCDQHDLRVDNDTVQVRISCRAGER